MPKASADTSITRSVHRRAVITLVVGNGPHLVALSIDDHYPADCSGSRRSLGPVGAGRYVVDLGLNVWRDREIRISATVDGQPVALRGSGDVIAAGEVAQIRLRDA